MFENLQNKCKEIFNEYQLLVVEDQIQLPERHRCSRRRVQGFVPAYDKSHSIDGEVGTIILIQLTLGLLYGRPPLKKSLYQKAPTKKGYKA